MENRKQTQREIVLAEVERRPSDPWPRGEGHVVLGVPGWPRSQKAYAEPGGSFSPSPGSFGVSFWAIDADGRRVADSDSLPLDQIKQHLEYDSDIAAPALVTQCPHYFCGWDWRDQQWRLTMWPNGCTVSLLIRSVGPAGAPVTRLDAEGSRLIVNQRWILVAEDSEILLGDEEAGGLDNPEPVSSVESENGWCFARINLFGKGCQTLDIRDTQPVFASPLAHESTRAEVHCELPDPRFSDSLHAQAAHILMGCIGCQPCPGDPTNYPLTWERDGAYAVVAMARAGQLEAARDLAIPFAENDFFGGFGPEGDAPGSAINAIVSVAQILRDQEFCEGMWPHVERKVGLIQEMREATAAIEKPWTGPIVPGLIGSDYVPIICQAAQDGLIIGAMDLHYPALYINAISHRGLVQAAWLAQTLGHSQEALEWMTMAEEVRGAYLRHFSDPEHGNERTYMSGIWPSWILDSSHAEFRAGLEQRWVGVNDGGEYKNRPLWTYFTAAEAHQWLFLNRPDRVWKTLRYFWENQCSPGLYTYWESDKEENTFHLWEHIRGWLKPKHVTPHYWTAAEMLLLQLDMLAYVRESPEPCLVVGAGIPEEWISQDLAVTGVYTSLGRVDWRWSRGVAEVVVYGTQCTVRLGPNFPTQAHVKVSFYG